MVKVFVYGTLMRGERADYKLEGASYMGDYMLEDYAMYDLGSFPGIKEKTGERVIGELYTASDEAIEVLDAYEGEGTLYERKLVTVRNSAGRVDGVYVYVYNHEPEGAVIREKWNAKQIHV